MRGIVRKLWCCGAKSFPSDSEAEEGHVRVFVGKDMQFKFEMEANYLNLFENLLKLSEEEFGFSYDGALRIACARLMSFSVFFFSSRPAIPPLITCSFLISFPSFTMTMTMLLLFFIIPVVNDIIF